jgi:hypothetical protein
VSQAMCAVSMCALMLVLLPPVGRGIIRARALPWSERQDFGDGWACVWHGVTRQVLPWAGKVEDMSVNEAVYNGVKWIRLQWGGVASPPKEMRRALLRAVWQHGSVAARP